MIQFSVFLSLAVPFLFFGVSHTIPSFIPYKYFFIALSFILALLQRRKLHRNSLIILAILAIKLIISIIFRVDSYRALMAFHVLATPFIYWCLFSLLTKKQIIRIFGALSFLEIVYGIIIFNFTPWQNQAALIGGHFTVMYILVSSGHKILGITSLFSSSIRFAVVYGIIIIDKIISRRLALLSIAVTLILPYLLVIGGTQTWYYGASAGYRVFEYLVMWSYFSEWNWIIGNMLGSTNGQLSIGSKGLVEHFGIFHNYWISLIVNLGILSIIPIRMIFRYSKLQSKYNVALYVIIVMMVFDSPRDGQWFLGLILSIIKNENFISPSRI